MSVVEMLSGLWELVGSEPETSRRLEFGDGKYSALGTEPTEHNFEQHKSC